LVAAIIEPPVFGFIADGWGMRTAIFGTGVYFLIGLALLLTIRVPKAAVD
jgi:hypothetical protein